jgi:hypothetical protein
MVGQITEIFVIASAVFALIVLVGKEVYFALKV